jgi:hypothetical protein
MNMQNRVRRSRPTRKVNARPVRRVDRTSRERGVAGTTLARATKLFTAYGVPRSKALELGRVAVAANTLPTVAERLGVAREIAKELRRHRGRR